MIGDLLVFLRDSSAEELLLYLLIAAALVLWFRVVGRLLYDTTSSTAIQERLQAGDRRDGS